MPARHVIEIPDAAGRVEVVEPGTWTGVVVEVDGRAIPKAGMFSRKYPIPTRNGRTFELEVTPDTFRGGVHVTGAGLDERLGEPIATWLAILAFLPFVLVPIGGALGGLTGGLGWGINRQIATTQSLPLPVRALLMLGVTFGAFVGWLVLAGAFALLLHR